MPYPTPHELDALYAERDAAIARLAALDGIDVADLGGLDRIGRYRVVTELWARCNSTARAALRADEHAHVRSAARLAGTEAL